MGIFEFLKTPNVNEGVKRFEQDTNALLLDVRTEEEYAEGHIPDSVNLPLQRIENAPTIVPSADTPLYVYCLSGARSARAVSALRQMGYTNTSNIGGISGWRGRIEG